MTFAKPAVGQYNLGHRANFSCYVRPMLDLVFRLNARCSPTLGYPARSPSTCSTSSSRCPTSFRPYTGIGLSKNAFLFITVKWSIKPNICGSKRMFLTCLIPKCMWSVQPRHNCTLICMARRAYHGGVAGAIESLDLDVSRLVQAVTWHQWTNKIVLLVILHFQVQLL